MGQGALLADSQANRFIYSKYELQKLQLKG